jgi:hypothetical protein
LIIGAAKAGTTTLFQVLAGHPQVCVSSVKETGFFSHDARYAKGLDWYADEYFSHAAGEAVRLEASPAYLTWSDKVAGRIRQSYERHAVKLIVILRDPVARAHSHYWHRVRLGHEPLSFVEALAQEEARLRDHWEHLSREGNGKFGYFRAGCYGTRLAPFFEHFDRGDLHVLLQEDLGQRRFAETMAQLLAFLQVDPTVPLKSARMNAPDRPRSAVAADVHRRLKQTFLRTVYSGLLPAPVRRVIRSALFAPASYPPIDPIVARDLRERYAGEVSHCATLIGRDLSRWLPSR